MVFGIVTVTLIKKRDACKLLSISTQTFDKLRKTDSKFPRGILITQKSVRWVKEEIIGYINSKREKENSCVNGS